jgi:hypothetical protein
MNIFITNACPVQSAQDHVNAHLLKQILESAQLLSTAHVVLDGNQVAYKATHQNHPSAIWTRQSKANYLWLFEHFKALCDEYEYRTGKVHKSIEHLKTLSKTPVSIDHNPLSEFVFVGPDEFRMKSLTCVHGAYKLYLKNKYEEWQVRTNKRQMPVSWGKRNVPDWM